MNETVGELRRVSRTGVVQVKTRDTAVPNREVSGVAYARGEGQFLVLYYADNTVEFVPADDVKSAVFYYEEEEDGLS